jgi:serine/threonine protein kinase
MELIGRVIGGYEILSLLGQGGMSTVYRARQMSVNREVAFKVIRPDLDDTPEFVRRFESEARTAASLSHAHIGKVFDYGQQDGMLFLVMELLRGGSLADVIRIGNVPLQTVARVLDHVASALDYAHERGVIHRDIKPSNILLDDSGNASLIDFGIAKLAHANLNITNTNQIVGSPGYIAPEEWDNLPLDRRADVYSLGITIYEAIVGKPPFEGSLSQVMRQHLSEQPPSILAQRPEIPLYVDQVVRKALSKDPAQRYSTAGEFAAAFRQAMISQPPELPEDPMKGFAATTMIRDNPNLAPVNPGARTQLSRGQADAPPPYAQPVGQPAIPAPDQPVDRPLDQPTYNLPRQRAGATLLGLGAIAATVLICGAVALGVWSLGRSGSDDPPTQAGIGLLITRTAQAGQTESPANATATGTNPTPTVGTGSDGGVIQPGFTPIPAEPVIVGGGTGRIIYVSEQGGSPSLFVADVRSNDVYRFSDFSSQDSIGAFSPDGAYLAFESNRDGNKEIYLLDAAGLNLRRITDHPAADWLPSWSPDGTQIVFTSERDGNQEIYIMDSNGSNVRRLTDHPAQDWLPAWSPDGSLIAFTSTRDGKLDVYVMDTVGGNVRRLTVEGTNFSSSWSPDGTRIAFVSDRDGNREVYTMNVDSTDQRRLTNNPAEDTFPSWSPDGTHIAFSSKRDGGNDNIYIVDLSTRVAQRITNGTGNEFGAIWQPLSAGEAVGG